MAWLIVGIYLAKAVSLHKIAAKIPGRAVQVSIERRLSRFLDNRTIRVRACYDPLVRPLLEALSRTGIFLIALIAAVQVSGALLPRMYI